MPCAIDGRDEPKGDKIARELVREIKVLLNLNPSQVDTRIKTTGETETRPANSE